MIIATFDDRKKTLRKQKEIIKGFDMKNFLS